MNVRSCDACFKYSPISKKLAGVGDSKILSFGGNETKAVLRVTHICNFSNGQIDTRIRRVKKSTPCLSTSNH